MTARNPITGHTRVYGLMGRPIRHSLSPAIYNPIFARHGVDAVYVAFDVDPDDAGGAARAIRTLGLAGCNLTVPLKERVMPHLDSLGPRASVVGSVNVVVSVDGALRGFNTDGVGLVDCLSELGIPGGSRAVVLGAGGTGRAVAAALLEAGWGTVGVLNRTVSRAEQAVADLRAAGVGGALASGPLTAAGFAAVGRGAGLVVNCTAGPGAGAVAALDPAVLAPDATWVDANYWMARPPQQDRCRDLGHRFVLGHGMLVHQARRSLSLFCGLELPATELRAHLPQPGAR